MTSRTLYVDEVGNIVVRSDLPPVRAEAGELLIAVLYSSVNPADAKSIRNFEMRSAVLGIDFCGRVPESPIESGFEADDVVAGYTYMKVSHCNTSCGAGGFKVPEQIPRPDAAAFMTPLQSTCDALLNRLDIPGPSDNPSPLRTTLVIWGGSTSLGVCAIQIARAAGVSDIIVTASASRHQMLKDLGATQCIDYHDDDVSAQVRQAVMDAGNTDIRAFESVGSADSYRSLVDGMSGLAGNIPMCFSFVHSDERPQSEFVMGVRHYDVVFPSPSGHNLVLKARPLEAEKIWKTVQWAIANYGARFKLPSVRVFEGHATEALRVLEDVAALGSFGKVVLQHPLQ